MEPDSPIPHTELPLIRSAGGLVWRETPAGRQVLLVHRPQYDDWTLPKGKLKPGETWEEAALREVREETGYAVMLGRFAGISYYSANGHPKLVLFWNMRPKGDEPLTPPSAETPGETDVAAWFAPAEALAKLTHANERLLVEEQQKRFEPQRREGR